MLKIHLCYKSMVDLKRGWTSWFTFCRILRIWVNRKPSNYQSANHERPKIPLETYSCGLWCLPSFQKIYQTIFIVWLVLHPHCCCDPLLRPFCRENGHPGSCMNAAKRDAQPSCSLPDTKWAQALLKNCPSRLEGPRSQSVKSIPGLVLSEIFGKYPKKLNKKNKNQVIQFVTLSSPSVVVA